MAQKGLWNIARKRNVGGQRSNPHRRWRLDQRIESAMHEAKILSSWLAEDVEGKIEETENFRRDAAEDSKSGKREEEGERGKRAK